MSIFFSIIIPTFNRAQFVVDTIQSILIQKDIPLEIIIVDDGSEDNTATVVRDLRDDRLQYIRTENRERGAARNLGMRAARGEYINYFDSDDIFNPCLFDLYHFIKNQNSPFVIFGAIENISESGEGEGYFGRPFSDFSSGIIHNNFLACGSVFVRSDVAHQFLFSENKELSGTEDWELWLRLYSQFDFTECPYVIFKQRNHPLRSMNEINVDKITRRETAFITLIESDKRLLSRRFSQSEINLLLADRYTLIALTELEGGFKIKAFKNWLRAIRLSVTVTQRRRFWAVAKKFFFRR